MPCDSVLQAGQDVAERITEIEAALKRLEAAMSEGRVSITIGPQGAIAFKSWAVADRAGVTDVCAIRRLMADNSWAFRQAVARAEAMAGRKANMRTVAAGVHSHDGGKTWGPGH